MFVREQKSDCLHELVIWIVHSADLFENTDSFWNETSDCLYEWIIWIILSTRAERLIAFAIISQYEKIQFFNSRGCDYTLSRDTRE